MPIKVTCQCGQSFAAKDELAGKTVKCPKCTQPLRIPENGPRVGSPAAVQRPPAAVASPGGAPQRAVGGVAQQPGLAAPLPSGGANSLFDEAGLGAAPVGTHPCPGCASPLPPSAVLCVKCGYNVKLGRRMETVRMTADPLAGGHDATATELLERAARSMEEEKEEERKKTKEGMPWWAYLIGLSCIIAFIVTMRLLPPHVAMLTGGILVWSIATLISLYASIRILIIAFTDNIVHGIGCLLCGLYTLIYCIMRWDQCGGYFLMMVGCNIAASIVQVALTFGLGAEKDDAALPAADPPAIVTRAEPGELVPLPWGGDALLRG